MITSSSQTPTFERFISSWMPRFGDRSPTVALGLSVV